MHGQPSDKEYNRGQHNQSQHASRYFQLTGKTEKLGNSKSNTTSQQNLTKKKKKKLNLQAKCLRCIC